MKTIQEIQKILKNHKRDLQTKYKVKEIGIFGSYVKQEVSENSDLDILVSFNDPIGMFKFLELEEYLQNLLGIKIDLVSKKALKPRIGKYILKEALMIW